MIAGVLLAGLLLQQPSSIEGVVVRAGTTHPIERAVVQLRGPHPSPLSMTTVPMAGLSFEIFRLGPTGSARHAPDMWIALTVRKGKLEPALRCQLQPVKRGRIFVCQ